jgi:peptidyl-prolyl cis-trans isomerase D
MLQNIREKFTGWIALAILGLIAVTFVFVGGASFTFIGGNYAAKVDGVEIGIGQFEQAYQNALQQNPQMAALPEEFRSQLRRRILEQLIQQRVVDNYLAEAGFQVSDDIVTNLIQQAPDFQKDGKFDMQTYREVLAVNGYVPAEFERAQRANLRRSQLERAIIGSAVLTPAAFRRYLNLAGEQRIVATATLDEAAVADEIVVSDDMIVAFYDDNPTLYLTPETADVQYVEISRLDVVAGVELTEEEIVEYYESNRDLYLQDEQRRARHILVLSGDDEAAAEATANELLARIEAGEPFEDLARTYSADTLTSGQGGDLGLLARSQLSDELGEAVFSMDEGSIAGPIRSDFGFHVVRLEEIREQGPLPLESVRAEVTRELRDRKADPLFRELERALSDALFDAGTIEELAAAVGAEVKSAPGFTREGGEPLGSDPAVINAVFDEVILAGEQMSEIVEIDGNRSAVFFVSSYEEASRQPLDDVRDYIALALRTARAEELMAARADEMVAAIAAGSGFADAAAAINATVSEPTLMTRADAGGDRFLSAAIFAAAKPSEESATVGSTRNDAGGYTIFSVEAVLPGRPESLPVEQRDEGKVQLTRQAGIGDFNAFVQALREDAEVIINDDAVAANESF